MIQVLPPTQGGLRLLAELHVVDVCHERSKYHSLYLRESDLATGSADRQETEDLPVARWPEQPDEAEREILSRTRRPWVSRVSDVARVSPLCLDFRAAEAKERPCLHFLEQQRASLQGRLLSEHVQQGAVGEPG